MVAATATVGMAALATVVEVTVGEGMEEDILAIERDSQLAARLLCRAMCQPFR